MITGSHNAVITWGRILRISLLPTALADICAGFALGALSNGELRIELLLFVSSACIYHGSMALNDWADREEDKAQRPDRPLARGLVQPNQVLSAAAALISLGVALAAILSIPLGAWMAGIASLAVGYNIWLRGRLSGPLSLGVCRGMHLAAPIMLVAPDTASDHAPLLIGYGLYVFTLSSLARIEAAPTAELKQTPRTLLFAIAAAFAVPLMWASAELDLIRRLFVTVLAAGGALTLVKTTRPPGPWTPDRVQRCVGVALRLLLVYTAAAALTGLSPYAWFAALLILAGYPLAHGLRKVFPPT